MTAIYRRELKSYFVSSMGYVFLTIFMLVLGVTFVFNNINSNSANMQSYYSSISPIYIIVFTVILTMRLFTDEKKNRTEVLLLTSPVSASDIVLGKYFAALTVYTIGIISTFIYTIFILFYTKISITIVFGGMISLILYGALFIAIGTFISSLTDNQVVSAIATFSILFFLYLAESFVSYIPNTFLTNLLYWISLSAKFRQISNGVLSISNLVYFISLTAFFLFLNVRFIEKKRWA